ncbi:hypothetical protein [Nocardioides speluncae]|uniref:hypothetical protein n=1 Tax=Nocardioides speluncae TaxID=2670337 RepID=UPI0012B16E60|nr:hypothetical protein [Nocardioides speluncae]
MRSGRSGVGEEPLPFELEPGPERPAKQPRPPRAVRVPVAVRIGDELAVARGWPAGTEVVIDRSRRAVRGDVVLFRERGVLAAATVDRQFGRPVLRNDRGISWIGLGADVVGVVVLVGQALCQLPPAPDVAEPEADVL